VDVLESEAGEAYGVEPGRGGGVLGPGEGVQEETVDAGEGERTLSTGFGLKWTRRGGGIVKTGGMTGGIMMGGIMMGGERWAGNWWVGWW